VSASDTKQRGELSHREVCASSAATVSIPSSRGRQGRPVLTVSSPWSRIIFTGLPDRRGPGPANEAIQ